MVNWIWLVVAFLTGHAIGWIRNLWQLRIAFPDLYAELKRRCNHDNP